MYYLTSRLARVYYVEPPKLFRKYIPTLVCSTRGTNIEIRRCENTKIRKIPVYSGIYIVVHVQKDDSAKGTGDMSAGNMVPIPDER